MLCRDPGPIQILAPLHAARVQRGRRGFRQSRGIAQQGPVDEERRQAGFQRQLPLQRTAPLGGLKAKLPQFLGKTVERQERGLMPEQAAQQPWIEDLSVQQLHDAVQLMAMTAGDREVENRCQTLQGRGQPFGQDSRVDAARRDPRDPPAVESEVGTPVLGFHLQNTALAAVVEEVQHFAQGKLAKGPAQLGIGQLLNDFGYRRAVLLGLDHQGPRVQGVGHGCLEQLGGVRLGQHVDDVGQFRVFDVRAFPQRRADDDRRLQRARQFEQMPTDLVARRARQLVIQQNQVRLPLGCTPQAVFCGRGEEHLVSFGTQVGIDQPPNRGAVVDHQDLFSVHGVLPKIAAQPGSASCPRVCRSTGSRSGLVR